MRVIKTVLFALCLVSSAGGLAPSKEWLGLVPLRSTRADVEKLFGPSKAPCNCVYESKEANVQVLYATGGCQSAVSSGWNVPPDTVIRFTVYPKSRRPLAELKIDERKHKRTEDPELPAIFYLTDEKEGLTISVDGETVIDYGFEPTAKDSKLRCPNSPQAGRP